MEGERSRAVPSGSGRKVQIGSKRFGFTPRAKEQKSSEGQVPSGLGACKNIELQYTGGAVNPALLPSTVADKGYTSHRCINRPTAPLPRYQPSTHSSHELRVGRYNRIAGEPKLWRSAQLHWWRAEMRWSRGSSAMLRPKTKSSTQSRTIRDRCSMPGIFEM